MRVRSKAKSERWLNRDAVDSHRQITAGKAVAMNVPGHGGLAS